MQESFLDAMSAAFQALYVSLIVFFLVASAVAAGVLYLWGKTMLQKIEDCLVDAMNFENMFAEPKE